MSLNNQIELSHTDWQNLNFDADLFFEIQNDLKNNATDHTPITAWIERGGGGGERASDLDRYHFQHMLQGWSGFGKNRIDTESVFWWLESLVEIDNLGLVERYFDLSNEWHCNQEHFLVSDLGVIWDVNVIASYLQSANVTAPSVVEVGGGYGRLAEAFFAVYGKSVKYLMIDSVPGSLMYAYVYLKKALVGKKVGIYYRERSNWQDYDCYIIPSWHLGEINANDYDLAINIQSMQEMYQHHVDYYLSLFNQIIGKGGFIYLCNRRDHRFTGNWKIPNNWQCLLKCMCPRSWLREFPAEVYVNSVGDFSAVNKLLDRQYQRIWTYTAAKILAKAKRLNYPAY